MTPSRALGAFCLILLFFSTPVFAIPAPSSIDVSTESELQSAITALNGSGGTINMTADITLTGALPAITTDIILNGADFALDADELLPVFDIESGSVTLQDVALVDAGMRLGIEASDTSTLVVDGTDGSSVTSPSQVLIGNFGHGTLTISNNGTFTTTTADDNLGGMLVGSEPDSDGEITVTGSESLLKLGGFLTVGAQGDGSMNIQAGGEVQATDSNLALSADTTATVRVEGAGSLFTLSKGLHIGRAGSGTLRMLEEGVVTVTESAYLGSADTASGTATIADTGTQWNIGTTSSHFLIIGGSGTGSLSVSGGGMVKPFNLAIGGNTEKSSELDIEGTQSQVDVNEYFGIGNTGPGTVNISNGGLLNGDFGDIGSFAGGEGVVNIRDTGSSLRLDSEELIIAYEGNGTLNLYDGGKLDQSAVPNPVIMGHETVGKGILNIGYNPFPTDCVPAGLAELNTTDNFRTISAFRDASEVAVCDRELQGLSTTTGSAAAPGIVDATGITTKDGTGEINFNHTSRAYYFTNDGTATGNPVLISGSTSVNQQYGTTILTGAHTYTGTTTVSGGTLEVNGSLLSDTTVTNDANLSGIGTLANVALTGTSYLKPGKESTDTDTLLALTMENTGIGRMSLAGNLSLSSTSIVSMDLGGTSAGTEHDQLQVTGTAILDGNLQIQFARSYTPAHNDRFTLITAGNISAVGDASNGFALISSKLKLPLDWYISYILTSTKLEMLIVDPSAPAPTPVEDSPPVITGDVSGQNLPGGTTVNPGGRVTGASISGTITNNGTLTGDLELGSGAVINGGTVSGNVNGSATNPGRINNATIPAGTTLNNVVIGPGTLLDPGVQLGANVRVDPTVVLPAAIDLSAALGSLGNGRSGPAVNLGSDVVDGTDSPSVLRSIQLMSNFEPSGVAVDQPEDGVLVVNSGDSLGYALPVKVSQADPEDAEGVSVNADGDIVLVTANRRVVITRPVLADNAAFNSALAALGLEFDYDERMTLTIEPTTVGADALLDNEGSNRTLYALTDTEFYYSGKPQVTALPAFRSQQAGLHNYLSTRLANISHFSMVFDVEGQLLEQDIVPVPADWPALKDTLSALPGVTDLRIQLNGVISVMLQGKLIQGEAGYRVVRSGEPTINGKLNISGAGDLNGDGIKDFMLTYANGDMQSLYIYP